MKRHILERSAAALPPPGSASLSVRVCRDPAAWDAFVATAPDASCGHRYAWLRVVARTYGHRTIALAAERDGHLRSVLPLVLVSSRLFGRRLVSMPYVDSAGIASAGDSGAEAALLDAALALSAELQVPLELRQRTARAFGLEASTHKVTMTVDLGDGEDAVWRTVKSNRRSQVRKARRNGLTVEVGGLEGVPDFYTVLAANMRDLGSPVHRRGLFEGIVRELGQDARILRVRTGERVVGAGLVLVQGDCMVLPFSSALRASFSLGTNQLLYWEAVRYAVARGCRVLDLGRSSPGSGTYEAKREWGAEPVQLHWYRHGEPAATGEAGEGLQWATRVWRRLPVPVATAAGQAIRGGLPQ